MTTIVFVHGTGVRGESYSRVFEAFRANVGKRAADIAVAPCGWGDFLGTTFAFGGASIPGHDGRPRDRKRADAEPAGGADFAVLTADPLHDLRFLALTTKDRGAGTLLPPGAVSFPDEIRARLNALPAPDPLARELLDRDLLAHFVSAVPQVGDAPVTQQAILQAVGPEDQARVTTALARGIIAETLRQAVLAEGISTPLHGAGRAYLIGLVEDRLGYAKLGAARAVGGLAARVLLRAGTWAFDRWRQPISDGAQPALGDVVWYLTRGAALRSAIAETTAAAGDDVVLVGHSLGGIACLDLLLTTPLPSVRTLVTVGSQGPLLYELDALPGLKVGAAIPDTLPDWINYYDRRDVLSYLAEPVFAGRARDVELDSGCYMPDAHSAYFDNQAFYDSLVNVIATAPAEGAGG